MSIFGGEIFPHAIYQIRRQQTTTDNTKTTAYAISLAEENTMYVRVFGTVRQDSGASIGSFETRCTCYRNSGGDITLLGSQHDILANYTAGSSCDVSLDIDSGTQSLDVNVTGETAKNFLWDLRIGFFKITY